MEKIDKDSNNEVDKFRLNCSRYTNRALAPLTSLVPCSPRFTLESTEYVYRNSHCFCILLMFCDNTCMPRIKTSCEPSSRAVLWDADRLFSSSIYPPQGHKSKGTKRGSVTYSTDRDWEGEVSKIFTHLYSVSDQTVVNWRKWLGNLVKLFVVCYCLLFWELTVRQTFARQKGRCVCWYN